MKDRVSIDLKDGVADVRLIRADKMNALDEAMFDALIEAAAQLAQMKGLRAVVLSGEGRAFCAGLDLKNRSRRNSEGDDIGTDTQTGLDSQRHIANIVMKMRRCPQPIVALVQGAAAGGGFALALAADIRIAATDARMNCAFIKLGIGGCDIGSSYFLPRLVGVSVASELILTGRFIHADRALRVGLVSEVVDVDKLEEAAAQYVDDMLLTSPLGLRLSKECLNMNIDAGSIQQAIALEDRNQILCVRSGAEFREGVSAFLEKRRPNWAPKK